MVRIRNTEKTQNTQGVPTSRCYLPTEPDEVSTVPQFTHGTAVGAIYIPVRGSLSGLLLKCLGHTQSPSEVGQSQLIPPLSRQRPTETRTAVTCKRWQSRMGLDATHCWGVSCLSTPKQVPASVPPFGGAFACYSLQHDFVNLDECSCQTLMKHVRCS